MSDLKTLSIQPKEYFEEVQDKSCEKRKPINLKYLFIGFIAISLISYTAQMVVNPVDLGEQFGIPGMSGTTFNILGYVITVISPLLGAWICVNILYLVSKMFISGVENKEIEDKKYFKSLLYFRYIVVGIVNTILAIIISFVLKDINMLAVAGAINNLFVKLWGAYILYGILKYYIGTNKVHKILPIILYIFTIIGTATTIASNMFLSSMPV